MIIQLREKHLRGSVKLPASPTSVVLETKTNDDDNENDSDFERAEEDHQKEAAKNEAAS